MNREMIEQAVKVYGGNHRIPYEGDIVDFAIQQVNAALEEAANTVAPFLAGASDTISRGKAVEIIRQLKIK